MSSVSKAQRESTWNVEFWYEGGRFAGVYQRDNMLSVADIAYELELCIIVDKPVDDDDAAHWQPGLMLRGNAGDGPQRLIVLDQQDNRPFPTPSLTPGSIDCYRYVFHSSSKCTSQELHSLNEDCIQLVRNIPQRRRDPCYLEVNQTLNDVKYHIYLINSGFISRAGSKKRGSSSGRTVSPSPTRTDTTNVDGSEGNADKNFRVALFEQGCDRCIISRKGNFRGKPGPGLEAAYVIPKSQWYTYPTEITKGIADPDNARELQLAAQGTFNAEKNGIMLMSDLHKCFDARVLAIHPKTHRVRAFIDYDIITSFHGLEAVVPRLLPMQVLQQHWDMCCLANSPAQWLSSLSIDFTNVPKLRTRLTDIINEEPTKEDLEPRASGTQSSNTQASVTQPSGTSTSGTQAFPTTSRQGAAHPPSLPPSDLSSEKCALWLERGSIKGLETTQQLMMEGGLFEETKHDDEYGRGRSREKRRCNATEGDTEQSCDAVHGMKRHRFE